MLTCHHDGTVTIDGTRYSNADGAALSAALDALEPELRRRAWCHLRGVKGRTISLHLSPHVAEWVDHRADVLGIVPSEVVRAAVLAAMGEK